MPVNDLQERDRPPGCSYYVDDFHLIIIFGTMLMLAGLFNASFAGLPFFLLGLAIAISHAFPCWLGWTAAAARSESIAAGLLEARA